MSVRKLNEMKKRLEEARTGRDRADGVVSTLRQRLRDEYGIDGDDGILEERAKVRIEEIDLEITSLDTAIDELTTDLEENYVWD